MSKLAQELDAKYAEICREQERRSVESLFETLSPASRRAVVALMEAGKGDPFGDGDQSPVTHLKGMRGVAAGQPLRDAWSSSLDVMDCIEHATPNAHFHRACFFGNAKKVRAEIARTREAAGGVEELYVEFLKELVERRISQLRLSALGYCALGARNLSTDSPLPDSRNCFEWKQCTEALLEVKANVNARDIAGYSILSICGAYGASERSVELIPLLTNAGADPNIKNRFDEPIIFGAIMSNNILGVKALVQAGADLNLPDRDGLTPLKMLENIPSLRKAVAEAGRERDLAVTNCDACGTAGARMRCMRCRSIFYCNATCQRAGWREHKNECADFSRTEYVDIDIDKKAGMLTDVVAPGLGTGIVFESVLTGRTSSGIMQPPRKGPEEVFIVKAQRPFSVGDIATGPDPPGASARSEIGAIRLSNKANNHILLAPNGPGNAAHTKLLTLIKSGGATGSVIGDKLYFAAKWLPKEGGGQPTVLRISTAKNLPAPKPLW